MIKRLWNNWIARGFAIGGIIFAVFAAIMGTFVAMLSWLGPLGGLVALLAIVCIGAGLVVSSEF